MLQWTCRLRDVLERRGFLADRESARWLFEMSEAEFMDPENSFPKEFRWNDFCDNSSKALMGYRNPPFALYPNDSNRAGVVRAIGSGLFSQLGTGPTKGTINVLWLSPTTFISPVKFSIESELHDYEMRLEKRVDPSSIHGLIWTKVYATSLSAFEDNGWEEPSPLTIQFVEHLLHCLRTTFLLS
jgi:hypothetical protein